MRAIYNDPFHKAAAAIARDWRKRNPEKQKEYNRRYIEKKAREMGLCENLEDPQTENKPG